MTLAQKIKNKYARTKGLVFFNTGYPVGWSFRKTVKNFRPPYFLLKKFRNPISFSESFSDPHIFLWKIFRPPYFLLKFSQRKCPFSEKVSDPHIFFWKYFKPHIFFWKDFRPPYFFQKIFQTPINSHPTGYPVLKKTNP